MYPLAPSRPRHREPQQRGTWSPQQLLPTFAVRAEDAKSSRHINSANVACPRCGRVAVLLPKDHPIDAHGRTREWICPGFCGFRSPLALQQWAGGAAAMEAG